MIEEFAASDVQSLAVLAFGKQGLKEMGIDAEALLRTTESTFGTSATYVKPDGSPAVTVNGVDFDSTKDMVSIERTAQLAMAYASIGNDARSQALLSELDKLLYKGTLPYATKENAATGFLSNTPYGKQAVISIAMYYLARTGDNLFTSKVEGSKYSLSIILDQEAELAAGDYPILPKDLKTDYIYNEPELTKRLLIVLGMNIQNAEKEAARLQKEYEMAMQNRYVPGQAGSMGQWVPIENFNPRQTGMELTGVKDNFRYYKFVDPVTGGVSYYKDLDQAYWWRPAYGDVEAYIAALSSANGGWVAWIPDMPVPAEGVIVRYQGDKPFYWQPSIVATQRYVEALKGYGYWAPVEEEVGVSRPLQTWTPAEIRERGLELRLDSNNPNIGWIKDGNQEIKVIFNPGQAASEEYLKALTSDFGGYIQEGRDGQKTWVISLRGIKNNFYIERDLQYNPADGTVTKTIQYYFPIETTKGTVFVALGPEETDTFAGGLLVKQVKNGAVTEYFYDNNDYAQYGVASKSVTRSADGTTKISEAKTQSIDPAKRLIHKEVTEFDIYGRAVSVNQQTLDMFGRLLDQRYSDTGTEYEYAGKLGAYGIASKVKPYTIINNEKVFNLPQGTLINTGILSPNEFIELMQSSAFTKYDLTLGNEQQDILRKALQTNTVWAYKFAYPNAIDEEFSRIDVFDGTHNTPRVSLTSVKTTINQVAIVDGREMVINHWSWDSVNGKELRGEVVDKDGTDFAKLAEYGLTAAQLKWLQENYKEYGLDKVWVDHITDINNPSKTVGYDIYDSVHKQPIAVVRNGWVTLNTYEEPNSIVPNYTKLEFQGSPIWEVRYPDQLITTKDAIKDWNNLPPEVVKALTDKGIDQQTLLQPATVTTAWGATWTDYRLPGDSRIIVSKIMAENPDVIVHVKWDDYLPVLSYKLSATGMVYKMVTDGSMTGEELFKDLPPQYLAKLSQVPGLELTANSRFTIINEIPLVRMGDSWVLAPNDAVTRYLIPDDPLSRHIARRMDDITSYVKWWEQGQASSINGQIIPAGIEPGLILVKNNTIMRETEYTGRNGDWNEYGVILDLMEVGKITKTGYNVVSGQTFEQHLYSQLPPMRIYFRDTVPLYSTAFDKDGKEYLFSKYAIKHIATAQGDHYVLIEETILTGDVKVITEKYGDTPVTLIKNSGVIYQKDGLFSERRTPFPSQWSLKDRLANDPIGQLVRFVSGFVLPSEEVQIIEQIKAGGSTLTPHVDPAQTTPPVEKTLPVYRGDVDTSRSIWENLAA
ncbi:MAG: hypothetical protein WC547_04140, partial [Candidatus Omnitrophota bacterium]